MSVCVINISIFECGQVVKLAGSAGSPKLSEAACDLFLCLWFSCLSGARHEANSITLTSTLSFHTICWSCKQRKEITLDIPEGVGWGGVGWGEESY